MQARAKEARTDAEFLTIEAAALLMNVGRSKIYELMDHRELASVRIGRSRRVIRESIMRYIERNTTAVSAA